VTDTSQLKGRVARHFSAPEWFTTFEFPMYGAVQSEDGKDRQLDALAISRIAGRGNEVVGIECKVSRSDWLRELAEPSKSSTWTMLLDRFYIAAGKDVVKKEELPATWGLLEESGSGLRKVVQPTLLSGWRENGGHDPIPREVWVRVLRRTLEGNAIQPLLQAEYTRGHEAGIKEGKEADVRAHRDAEYALSNLRRNVAEFEKASGVKIEHWAMGEVGKAVQVVLQNKDVIRTIGNNTTFIKREFDELLEKLQAAGFVREDGS
jgi:hypothetical protein